MYTVESLNFVRSLFLKHDTINLSQSEARVQQFVLTALRRLLHFTKQSGLQVTLYTCILEALGSNIGWRTAYLEIFRDFTQPLQKTSGLHRIGHHNFLPNPHQFIIQLSSYHSTLYRCPRRKSHILGGHTINHSKQKTCRSTYSSKSADKKDITFCF
jgi:hypothetical protein